MNKLNIFFCILLFSVALLYILSMYSYNICNDKEMIQMVGGCSGDCCETCGYDHDCHNFHDQIFGDISYKCWTIGDSCKSYTYLDGPNCPGGRTKIKLQCTCN